MPNPGMGLQAKRDFPEIEFSKSIMVGNTISDMEFGRRLNIAINIFIPSTHPQLGVQHPMVDLVFPDLLSVSKAL
jgi:D-glycero-D-manno-heptose 1,7-bisphosphate phosphatase